MTEKLFGEFVEPDDMLEYIKVNFLLNPMVRQLRWQNGGLSTRFLLEYWETFFPLHNRVSLNEKTGIGYTLRFIANELLENVLMHADANSPYPARFSLYLLPDSLRFYVSNSIQPDGLDPFQAFIQEILTADLDELYVRQVESTMKENKDRSGMGFLTLLSDYQAKLAWKFETIEQTPAVTIVTTMVQVPI